MSVETLKVLKKVFGHSTFRGSQEEVVDHVVAGGDGLVLFPTGLGKSVCYQVPGLCMVGTTVVVSPLIALMRDQVAALRALGVNAGALNSSTDADEAARIRADHESGMLDFLYVAPERLMVDGFLEWLARGTVALFAIDEAHCVSSWGHDFRPEYLRLAELRTRFPGVPRVAMTATADPQTREDVRRRLGLLDAPVFSASFDRPNIRYAIAERADGPRQILDFVRARPGVAGIVYCLSRDGVDETAAMLRRNGVEALPYHAGLDRGVRDANQDAFLREDLCLVATVAFGMGIDKPDIRYVAHLDLSSSVEALSQEWGRAGRDGLPAEAMMLYAPADVVRRRRMIDMGQASDDVKRVERSKLDALVGICESVDCRRQAILGHFGEAHPGGCGNCDACLEPRAAVDGTVAAQKVLSAVARTGRRYGAGHVVDVLRGTRTEKVLRARHEELPTFGVGRDGTERHWRSVVRQLLAQGLLVVDHDSYGALAETPEGAEVLAGRREVRLRVEAPRAGRGRERDRRGGPATRAPTVVAPASEGLFQALRAERSRIAREQGVAPYIVFNDATLVAMAERRPGDLEAMRGVPGVGEAKLDRYGADFLAVLRAAA